MSLVAWKRHCRHCEVEWDYHDGEICWWCRREGVIGQLPDCAISAKDASTDHYSQERLA